MSVESLIEVLLEVARQTVSIYPECDDKMKSYYRGRIDAIESIISGYGSTISMERLQQIKKDLT